MAQQNPNTTAVFLENFALRSLVVKARLAGVPKSAFLQACAAAWDTTPERLTSEGSPLRTFLEAWTKDDDPNPGKPGGR